jgi:capsular polysaccharide biosynthesis protein
MPDVATATPERSFATTNGGPPPGPFQAIVRHPLLALLPVLVLVAAALVIGEVRSPVYTSQARLGVGTLRPESSGDQPSADATNQLASTYSRAIDAEAVARRVSRKTGLPRSDILGNLSASALADSPLVKVEAKAKNKREAVGLARAGSDALIRYVSSVAGAGTSDAQLLQRFKDAQEKASAAEAAVTDSSGDAKDKAEADFEAASLKAKALKLAYVQQTQGSGGGQPLRVLNPAERASSDQTKKLRLYLVVGALAGILAGVALATARAARQH